MVIVGSALIVSEHLDMMKLQDGALHLWELVFLPLHGSLMRLRERSNNSKFIANSLYMYDDKKVIFHVWSWQNLLR